MLITTISIQEEGTWIITDITRESKIKPPIWTQNLSTKQVWYLDTVHKNQGGTSSTTACMDWLSCKKVSLMWIQCFSRKDCLREKIIEMSPAFPLKLYEQRQVRYHVTAPVMGSWDHWGARLFIVGNQALCSKHWVRINHTLLTLKSKASKRFHSKAIEESFLVPQRTFQLKFLKEPFVLVCEKTF